jgi:hypothetical protein
MRRLCAMVSPPFHLRISSKRHVGIIVCRNLKKIKLVICGITSIYFFMKSLMINIQLLLAIKVAAGVGSWVMASYHCIS